MARRYDLIQPNNTVLSEAWRGNRVAFILFQRVCMNIFMSSLLFPPMYGVLTSDTLCTVCIGTEVPSDLILVHDFKDHYSLQPAKEMTVDGKLAFHALYITCWNCGQHDLFVNIELNESITTFLQDNATRLSKEEWMRMYPGPTERM